MSSTGRPRCARAATVALLSCFVATGPGSPLAADDAALEQRIADRVTAGEARALELLEELVEINSGTMNFAGVRRVGEGLGEELARLGFEVASADGAAFGRAGHLSARRAAAEAGAPTVLLIGHLDTVFEPDSPFQQWRRVDAEEGHAAASGPGVTDMKVGDVVMLMAREALHGVGVLDELEVRVVLTGDEEKAGEPLSEARAVLRELADGATAAIGFEDGDSDPRTAVIARRGASGWILRSRGTPAHSSQIFQPGVGAGAIFELARVLEAFRRELAEIPDLTFNPGVVLGGTDVEYDDGASAGEAFGKSNVIAETATASGDLRALSPADLRRARRVMEEVVATPLAGADSTIEWRDGYPPMAASDGNRALLALYDRVSRDLGHGAVTAVDPRNAGAADISFVAEQVPHCLDGIGLMGRGGHTTDETADLRTLVSQAQRAAVLLLRIARGGLVPRAEASQ